MATGVRSRAAKAVRVISKYLLGFTYLLLGE
jgi:hypothetical protein